MSIEHLLGKVHNCDCLEFMKQLPDKCVDLVLTDPPYGIGIAANPVRQMHEKSNWDSKPPTKEVFEQISRISKWQIIWGGNYFGLPASQGFYIWDKIQPEDFSLAMAEMAWTNMKFPAKIFRYSVLTERDKKHPTQKPVALYEWILQNYAKEGDLILDTHLGSGSSRIAAHKAGLDFVGFEIDREYFDNGNKRFKNFVSQGVLF